MHYIKFNPTAAFKHGLATEIHAKQKDQLLQPKGHK